MDLFVNSIFLRIGLVVEEYMHYSVMKHCYTSVKLLIFKGVSIRDTETFHR